jgi:hypothetical protein
MVIGWLLLVAVVAVSSWQVQQLEQQTQQAVETVRTNTCGAWLGTYQSLNAWAAISLPPKEAKWVRERFAADFNAHCHGYEQTMH